MTRALAIVVIACSTALIAAAWAVAVVEIDGERG
jgi:hypothetical protein